MISVNDFLMPDGKIDWQAYDKARIDAGEKCKKCGKHLLFPKGYPEECFACKDLGSPNDTVSHESIIRCPYCRWETNEIWEMSGYGELYSEGEHIVDCPECEKKFEVSTMVSFEFTSRPIQGLT